MKLHVFFQVVEEFSYNMPPFIKMRSFEDRMAFGGENQQQSRARKKLRRETKYDSQSHFNGRR